MIAFAGLQRENTASDPRRVTARCASAESIFSPSCTSNIRATKTILLLHFIRVPRRVAGLSCLGDFAENQTRESRRVRRIGLHRPATRARGRARRARR